MEKYELWSQPVKWVIVFVLAFLIWLKVNPAFGENAVKVAFDRNVLVTNSENGTCSGFIIETGVVLTAKHCVQTNEIKVDGVIVSKVIQSEKRDVARLEVKTKPFKRIAFARNISLGDEVRMVANPNGHVGWSFNGEISYLEKERGIAHTSFIGAPGTSGAGVINAKKEFYGIHTGYYYFQVRGVEFMKISGIFTPHYLFQELIKEVPSVKQPEIGKPEDLSLLSQRFR